MKLFHYLAPAAILLFAATAPSCSDDNEPEAPVNHIYLKTSDGTSTMIDKSGETVTVAMSLSAPVAETTTFTIETTGIEAGLVEVEGNPVSIQAGATTATFTVKATGAGTLTQSKSFSFTIANLNSAKFDITQNATITLLPDASMSALTPEQRALVAAWRDTYGIDMAPWIGPVSLRGTIEFPGDGYRTPFIEPATIALSGHTVFGLGADASEATPVLDMTDNPMGMSEYLYKAFRQLTIDDNEYFTDPYNEPALALMEMLGWNATSEETFGVSLPGLKITQIKDGKATVEFVSEGDDFILGSDGNPIYSEVLEENLVYSDHTSWIPFVYDYSAWSRQLALLESNDPTAMEAQSYGNTAAPGCYLGIGDVLKGDDYDEDEDEDEFFVVPHAEIDFNAGTMTFVFPFMHGDQYGYSRVTVTYTLAE